MAQPEAFSDRLEVSTLYRERFCVAFPIGHRFREKNRVRIPEVAGETYLARINCEYQDHLNERCREHGFALQVGFRSEREDWIQMMVAAGFGICFIPEFSPTIPGVLTRLGCRPGSGPRGLAGVDRRPAFLACRRRLRPLDPGVQMAGGDG